jgi:polyribonucleotide nucleotidyltransferase
MSIDQYPLEKCIVPGTEGLLHISEMAHGRTERTEDVVKKGDRVKVKLIERDERGRLRLSMKALVPKPEGVAESENGDEGGDGSARHGGEGEPRGEGREGRESREGRGGGEGRRGGGRPRRGGGGGGRRGDRGGQGH